MKNNLPVRFVIILAFCLPSISFPGSSNAFSVQADLSDWFIKNELRYCRYAKGTVDFYVIKRAVDECAATARGEFEPPKAVKKPTLKVPRTWKDTK
ncbi:hypothetical protein ACPV4B_02700 [Vibrio parahaemolyticus]|uniref:hypothetical protein n=1 Tax=Vibrio mediterranei TaxID=689 RepID=UPI004067733C